MALRGSHLHLWHCIPAPLRVSRPAGWRPQVERGSSTWPILLPFRPPPPPPLPPRPRARVRPR
eukprot:5460720-Pyramimonas_sp.AAC.1